MYACRKECNYNKTDTEGDCRTESYLLRLAKTTLLSVIYINIS